MLLAWLSTCSHACLALPNATRPSPSTHPPIRTAGKLASTCAHACIWLEGVVRVHACWCEWVAWVACAGCVSLCACLCACERTYMRVRERRKGRKRAGHTRSSKAIACLLQKLRLDMLCDLVGWRMVPPHAQVAVLSNRIRHEGGRGSGEGYLKSSSSSSLVRPVHKGSHLPQLLKNTTHPRTPDQTDIHIYTQIIMSPW